MRSHSAAALLHESGTLTGELTFIFPTEIAVSFLRPDLALEGLPVVRRLPGPLRFARRD